MGIYFVYYNSAYDKDWKLSRHFVNLLTSPLIMYSKICLFKFGVYQSNAKLSDDWLLS